MTIFVRPQQWRRIHSEHEVRNHPDQRSRSTSTYDRLIEQRERDSLEYLKLPIPAAR